MHPGSTHIAGHEVNNILESYPEPIDIDQESVSEPLSSCTDGYSLNPLSAESPSLHPMGQSGSVPSDEQRDPANSHVFGSFRRQQDNQEHTPGTRQSIDGILTSERAAAARLRRSRRLQNHIDHFTRFRNRLVPSGTPPSSASSTITPSTHSSAFRNRVPGLRFRARTLHFGRNRSSSPANNQAEATARRRRTMPPISRPIPIINYNRHTVDLSGDMMDISPPTVAPQHQQQHPQRTASTGPNTSRRTRISRVRDSITSWPDLLTSGLGSVMARPSIRRPSEPSRSSHLDDPPRLNNSRMDFEHTGASEPTSPNETRSSSSPPPESPDRPIRPQLFGPNLLDNLQNPGRIRPGEDQAAMLSRLLSVAAAATAATLVGNAEEAITQARDVAGENGGDGSFESFLAALQNGRLESALRNGGNEMGGGTASPDSHNNENGMMSLNFFRMFRFGSMPATNEPGDNENENGQGGRLVPVIIVGIRSVHPRDSPDGGDLTNRPPAAPFLDALADLPMPIPTATLNRRRLSHRRASSMGGMPDSPIRSGSHGLSASEPPSVSLNEISMGPNPPPTTPADPTMSIFPNRSFGTSPNRHSSTLDPIGRDHRDSLDRDFITGHHSRRLLRRRSSTERPRSVNVPLSAGDGSRDRDSSATSHAYGPNRPPPSTAEGTRSWIIYVLGGQYPENHLIFTSPSLFTDVSYLIDLRLSCCIDFPAGTNLRRHDNAVVPSRASQASSGC
jgi:hypothetical protein